MESNSVFSLSLHDTSILKGIAICAMLWHHLFYENPEYGLFVWHLALLGKVCVAIFLLLSGYGLTIQMNRILDRSQNVIRGGIFAALLLSSLAVSVVLEALKTKLKIYVLVSRITSKFSV